MASSNEKEWSWNYMVWVENHTPSGIKRSCDGSCTPAVDHSACQLINPMGLMRLVNRCFLIVEALYLHCSLLFFARLDQYLSALLCNSTVCFDGGGVEVLVA